MGLLFYPRGGSAQVIRYLAAALAAEDWTTSLVCGSLGGPGDRRHAHSFFAGLEVAAMDYRPALEAWGHGRDPVAEPAPMHPSYEDRPDVPDRIFAAVAPELRGHLASAWQRLLSAAADPPPHVLHLHHLTPIHEAAANVLPGVPLVTHLHGTELKMIDRVEALTRIAHALGADLAEMADLAEAGRLPPARDARTRALDGDALALLAATRWAAFRHGAHWVEEMRRWATRSDRLIVISPNDREQAGRLLGVDPGRVDWVPNGVDVERFDRSDPRPEQRLARWRRWLVEEPLGWREGGEPGSVRYTDADLGRFVDPLSGEPAPVLLFVGRFTEVKRIPLLVRAYARARSRFERRAPLVIWGGFPGEWEGEHPHTVVLRERIEDVFFIGWRGHGDLGAGLACSEVMVMPSIDESFGQVFVEAMACAVPVIAARAGGPPSFINTESGRPNGWLVEPDDMGDLAGALVEAVNDPAARAERARNGYESTRREYSWSTLAKRVAGVYEKAIDSRR
jgi:glycosyltransferase involved in cell wall biosynthesis